MTAEKTFNQYFAGIESDFAISIELLADQLQVPILIYLTRNVSIGHGCPHFSTSVTIFLKFSDGRRRANLNAPLKGDINMITDSSRKCRWIFHY